MRHRLRVPIRVKFMLTFLILVTGVVGLITFSTASVFHDDKQAYVNGLTSMVSLGTAEEARSTLESYHERLSLYARLIVGGETTAAKREAFSRTLFDEFPDLLSVVVEQDHGPPASVYNMSVLEAADLQRADFEQFQHAHPLPADWAASGKPFIRNTTISARLPCFTMAFTQAVSDTDRPARVVAVLLGDRLLRLTSRFKGYEQFLVDSEGTIFAHSDPRRVVAHDRAELPPQTAALLDGHSAEVTAQYAVQGTEMIGGFATVDFGQVTAGAQIQRSAANLATRRVVNRLLEVAGLLLVLAIILGFLWAHRITRPMEHLSDATRAVAAGSFDVAVDIESHDEMGDLASSFNQMAVGLKQRDIALREANAQLVQSEKMAAFGQLGAGIAHEVKNPLAGILSCAQLAAEDAPSGSQIQQDLQLIEREARRCKATLDNLLKFARQEKVEMQPIDVNGVVQDCLAILNHQMSLKEVRVENDLQHDLPPVVGSANQLQQVFMNLMINAQQAMEGRREPPATIHVTSRAEGDSIDLRFSDNGPGIPVELHAKVFEPFFTTKAPGQGTGLGLSVSFGIIKDHRGSIAVESAVGKGTTFVIRLPVLDARSAEAHVRSRELVPA